MKETLISNQKTRQRIAVALIVGALGMNGSCISVREDCLEVTATAYSSHADQTDDSPDEAAWGDELRPGMKTIAVSRDLIGLGLTRGVRVRIEGFPGRFVVLDKMARRWRSRIDIYMGKDIEGALAWGERRVRIYWPGNWIRRSALSQKR